MKTFAFENYSVDLSYDPVKHYFVASIPIIPFCSADGKSGDNAIRNLRVTFDMLRDSYCEDGLSFPEPA